jgi:hypothetical protein
MCQNYRSTDANAEFAVQRKTKAMNGKTIGLMVAILVGVLLLFNEQGLIQGGSNRVEGPGGGDTASAGSGLQAIADAYRAQRSDVQVKGEGVVKKVLSDDRDGSRHQRFLLRLPNRQTLLVAHNIDLAPRIDGLREGDRVAFYGEYEWNKQGGVIHWTHHDPGGRHVDGWLEHRGRTYQ